MELYAQKFFIYGDCIIRVNSGFQKGKNSYGEENASTLRFFVKTKNMERDIA